MGVVFTNNAISTLAAGITAGQTTITVQAADAAKFPVPAAGDWFPVTVTDGAANLEIMRCTAIAGAVLTVTRAQEGTTGKIFNAGAQVDHRLTKVALQAFLQDAPIDAKLYGRLAGAWAEALPMASYTDAAVLAKIKNVDGVGSGLDADLLDGQSGAYYLDRVNHTGVQAISTVTGLQSALDAKAPEAPNDANAYVRSGLAWVIGYTKAAIDTLLGGKVAKVGDTMTGALTLAHPTATNSLILNKVAGNNWNLIESQVAGSRRWLFEFGNNVAESGSNAGTNIAIDRYNDAGVAIDVPWSINRATGIVGMPLGATTATPAAGDNDTSVATTAFVTNADTSTPVVPKLTLTDTLTNWDAILTPGWFNGVLGTTNTNHPVPGKYFYCLVLNYTGTTNFTQVAFPFGQAADIAAGIWMRGRTGGVWSAWVASPVGAVVKSVKETLIVASGTFTPDPNVIYADVDAWGGGGAGGGHAITTTTNSFGGGGSTGGKASGTFTKAELGASVACTIGAGGAGVAATSGGVGTATTFGTLLSAVGGPGGTCVTSAVAGSINTALSPIPLQSAIGEVRGWTITGGGGLGTRDAAAAGFQTTGGWGGSTEWGGYGREASVTSSGAGGGPAAANTGSGGGGAAASNNNPAGRTGGGGGSGVIRVREYLSV